MAVSDAIRKYFLKEHGISLEQAAELVGSADPSALAKAGVKRDNSYGSLSPEYLEGTRPTNRRDLDTELLSTW